MKKLTKKEFTKQMIEPNVKENSIIHRWALESESEKKIKTKALRW